MRCERVTPHFFAGVERRGVITQQQNGTSLSIIYFVFGYIEFIMRLLPLMDVL